MLEGLAKLTPLAATNFQRLLHEEASRFPWGSTIVVVSALMTDALAQTIEELLNERHRVILLRIGEFKVPQLPNLVVHTLPDDLVGKVFTGNRYARMINGRDVTPCRAAESSKHEWQCSTSPRSLTGEENC